MGILFVIILISPNGGFEQFEYPVVSWEACLESVQFTRGINLDKVIKHHDPHALGPSNEYRAVAFCVNDSVDSFKDSMSMNPSDVHDFKTTTERIERQIVDIPEIPEIPMK